MQWTVIIAAKSLPAAKSRLSAASAGPEQHRELVQAIRRDTVDAARATTGVARVLIVTDHLSGDDDIDAAAGADEILLQSSPGLNGALRDAAGHAAQRWPDDGIVALVGDLPALRPTELAQVLESAVLTPAGFVADTAGTGTTLLTARPGQVLDPQFGTGSSQRHSTRATRLQAGASVRCDVDTVADLDAAATLGLGPLTAHIRTADTTVRSAGVHDDVA